MVGTTGLEGSKVSRLKNMFEARLVAENLINAGLAEKITEMYDSQKMSQFEIVDELEINGSYGASSRAIARSAISMIVNGCNGVKVNGHWIAKPLEGQLSEEESERVRNEHFSEGGRKSYSKGLGARTKGKVFRDSSSGGSKACSKGLGIFARSVEEHKEDSRIGGRTRAKQIALERGYILWVEQGEKVEGVEAEYVSEVRFAYALTKLPEYEFDSESSQRKHLEGKPNLQLIAEKLNELYHKGKDVRNAGSVSRALYKFRKREGL